MPYSLSALRGLALGLLFVSGAGSQQVQFPPPGLVAPPRAGQLRESVPLPAAGPLERSAPAAYRLHGLGFSPYVDGQNPDFSPQIGIEQIRSRMQIVAPYTIWVRSFGSSNGLEKIPVVAREFGLKVAAGAWIGRNLAQNAIEISNLIAAAQAGLVDLAIVGSEALLRNDVTEAQLLGYMQQVRQALPPSIPVTTADTFDVLIEHPNIIAASDIVFPNIYPYWMGISFSNAICALDSAYQQVVAAAGGKPIIISEAGGPSDGGSIGAAVPSAENASLYFLQFVSWARARNLSYFYFSAFDELWKVIKEGAAGAHWGVWTKDGVMKPGMQQVFDGQTVAVDCNGTPAGPGMPSLKLIYVPPYGSSDFLQGQALHVSTADNDIAVYLRRGGWWIKPTEASPRTPLLQDGSWSTNVVTGGSDALTLEYAVFLIPKTYPAPILLNAVSLPAALFSNSLANVQISRLQNAISGKVVDAVGNPLAGVQMNLTGVDAGPSGRSAPDGRYSFVNITATGTNTVCPSYPNYVFSPACASIPPAAGNQIANFTGTAAVDLSLSTSALPAPVIAGSNLTDVIVVTNSGLTAVSNAIATITLPNSFTMMSVLTDRGSCSGTSPITCNLGAMVRSASAAITVVSKPTVAGNFNITSSVTGPQPDLNLSNNSSTQALVVTVNAAPTVVAVNPSGNTASTQTFSFVGRDPNGFVDVPWMQLIFNGTLTGMNACYVHYDRIGNQVFLLNDSATGWLGPVVLGSANSVQNSQCIVNALTSSASAAGTDLTVNLALTFKVVFGGTKNVYMQTQDLGGLSSGWQLRGTWTPFANLAPSTVSVAPSGNTGATQAFSFVFRDPNGFTNLPWVQIIFSGSLTGRNACYVHYDRLGNQVFLLNDSATGWLGPIALATANSLQNSQCDVNALSSSASGSGTDLTVNLAVNFKVFFGGVKNIYLQTQDLGGLASGWQQRGTWTSFPNQAPSAVSVAPSGNAGAAQVFGFVFRDPNGFTDLPWVQLVFGRTLTGLNACYVHYDRLGNQVFLLNDSATGWLGPVVLGSASSLQNSQCTINALTSSAPGAGTDLTVNLALTFKPAFAGAKNVYLQTQDNGGLATGWQLRGTWTAQ